MLFFSRTTLLAVSLSRCVASFGAGLAALEELDDLFEDVFGEGDVEVRGEPLAVPPPAKRPRLPPRISRLTPEDLRVLRSFERGSEPICLGSGDGSLAEELAAADEEIVVVSDLGAAPGVEAPEAKRARVS